MAEGQGGAARAKVAVSAVEALIAELPGVQGARIVLDDWGAVREVHVLADSSRAPKVIVRDIESALHARWGLVVDHRRISIAQVGDLPPRPKWARLRLQQFAVTSDTLQDRMEVSVSLVPEPPRDIFGRALYDPEVPDVVWQGRAAGAAGAGGPSLRLAAEATLEAVNQALRAQHRFTQGEVVRVALGDRQAVLCLLHYHTPRNAPQDMTGSALVRGDALEAAVRAVLNGTNRLYGVAMRRQAAVGQAAVAEVAVAEEAPPEPVP